MILSVIANSGFFYFISYIVFLLLIGKGRGRQVIAVARTADLIIIMLDATKSEVHRLLLEKELEAVGIRLNKKRPNIYFKEKKTGGLTFNSTCVLTKMDEKMVQLILHEYSKWRSDFGGAIQSFLIIVVFLFILKF